MEEDHGSVDVYDFDKTIYDGDSTLDFWYFCLRHSYKIALHLPKTLWYFVKYLLGFSSKTRFKEVFFEFLKDTPDIDAMVLRFWEASDRNIKAWFHAEKHENSLIISASPEFLLPPVAKKLGVRLIASKVEKTTGSFLGENCYGEEKCRRLDQEFSRIRVCSFYSDSRSDTPLAKRAEHPFMVSGNEKISWDSYHPTGLKKNERDISDEKISFISFVRRDGNTDKLCLFSGDIHTGESNHRLCLRVWLEPVCCIWLKCVPNFS